MKKWIISIAVIFIACILALICCLGILAIPDEQTGESILPMPSRAPTWVLTIGKTYYLPWGSSLCGLPGNAALDELNPQYCKADIRLDLYPKEFVLMRVEGDWCYGEGEYRSLEGPAPVAGWYACRYLTTMPQ